MKIEALTPEKFVENLQSGRYSSAGNAKKASSRTKWSDKLKESAKVLIDKQFDGSLTTEDVEVFTGKKAKLSPTVTKKVKKGERAPLPPETSADTTPEDVGKLKLVQIKQRIDLCKQTLDMMFSMPDGVDISAYQKVQDTLALLVECLEYITKIRVEHLKRDYDAMADSGATGNDRPHSVGERRVLMQLMQATKDSAIPVS